MRTTTRQGLQALQVAPLNLNTAEESLNSTSLETPLTKRENSTPLLHSGSGYNIRKDARMSGVFVLSVDGKPLTPTTNARARKLLKSGQAKPVWNKFGCFGIKMLTEIRKETICEFGQICGGTKNQAWIYNSKNKRIGKVLHKITWLSHNFKTKRGEWHNSSPPCLMARMGSPCAF